MWGAEAVPLPTTDWPPSPPAASTQPAPDLYDQVPLSCVPPSSSSGCAGGLVETLWNMSVARFRLRLKMRDGTAFRSCRQRPSSSAASDRVAQLFVWLTYAPLVRTRPPSEPTNASAGLFGEKAIEC